MPRGRKSNLPEPTVVEKNEHVIRYSQSGVEITSFMDEELDEPIVVPPFTYSEYTTVTSAKNSSSWPSDSTILNWLNKDARTAALAKAKQQALTDKRTEYEATDTFKNNEAIKSLMNAGFSRERAEAMVGSDKG